MAKTIFSTSDIPYGQLNKFGLTQEMIDDLPQTIMDAFLNGKLTPSLPLVYTDENGEDVQLYAKMGLSLDTGGVVNIAFVPHHNERELEEFTQEQIRFLLAGDVITTDLDGQGYCYVQYNEEVNQTMAVPVEVVSHNIQLYTGILSSLDDMADTKISMVQTGKVVEFGEGENMVTIGVDLTTPKGIRRVSGDKEMWTLEKNEGVLPKYNFGIYGCWIKGEDNNLKYVLEADYTEEIYNEMSRTATQRASSYRMRR